MSASQTVTVNHGYPRTVISHTISEAIEIIGVGKVQMIAVLAATLCLTNYILDTIGIGMIVPAAQCELQLDTQRKGYLLSVYFLGLMLTGHVWGFLSDTIGRQPAIFLSLSSSILLSIAAALTPNYWIILLLRLLSGMANAGSISTMYAYVGELLPNKARSKLMVLIGFGVTLPMFLMSGVGWLFNSYGETIIISESYSVAPWRQQLILLTTPGMISAILFYCLPESPKFLLSQGSNEKAMKVLRNIHQKNIHSKLPFPIDALKDEPHHAETKRSCLKILSSFLAETKLLFQGPYLWPMVCMCVIQYGLFTVGAAFATWYPELTNRLSASEPGTKICDIFSPAVVDSHFNTTKQINWNECTANVQDKMFFDNMVIGVGYLISNILFFFVNQKVKILYIVATAMAISSVSAFLLPSLTNELVIVICFSTFIIGSGASISASNILLVQIFPVFVCGMALSIAMLSGRLGTFIGGNGFGILLESDCELVIYGTAVLIGMGVVCLFLLPKKIVVN